MSRGLIFGAEKVGNLLNQNTPKLLTRINSSEQPTQIPRKVSRGMQVAETATNRAAQVTGYVGRFFFFE